MAMDLIGVLSCGVLMLLSVGFVATIPLMRRRSPDIPDHPTQHDMPCEAVTFSSRDGVQLAGWWIQARDTPRGTVIVCPGQNGSMDKDVPQVVPLHQANFNVLLFDFRAHGRSEGHTVTLGAGEQSDLLGALDYLADERADGQVGALGFSMGAGVALMVASQDDRIAALVVDGAYPRLGELLTNWLRLRNVPMLFAHGGAWLVLLIGSLRTRRLLFRANPHAMVARITIPTLFIHGEQDPFVTTEQIERLTAQTAGPTDLWRVVGSGHRGAYHAQPEEYNHRMVAWFEQHMRT